MKQNYKIHIITLGCPKNIVDSESILGALKYNSAELVKDINLADVVIINTCGFIKDAKQESIETILNVIELKKSGKVKKIIVVGCLSARYKNELETEMPEVDAFFGTHQTADILNYLGNKYKKELVGERIVTTPPHYAYLKISDGCNNPCSFCAIPLMRGKYFSVPMENILYEAKLLANKGVKELILIAQDTTSYGVDIYRKRYLSTLMNKLNDINGIEWIRLMYAYPAKFPLDIIETFNACDKLCKYIDIPIQHCADNVLKSMQRGITKKSTYKLLHKLKNDIPNLAIRTTLIVGYPNETREDFNELCNFVKEFKFERLGVFTYSKEEGTEAEKLGDPISKEEKLERYNIIMEIQKNISEENNSKLIGKNIKIIIDEENEDNYIGRTQWDAPEIDQEVFITKNKLLNIGDFYNVTVKDSTEYDLYADINN